MNTKMNKAVGIIAQIVEVFMWIGAGMSLAIAISAAAGQDTLVNYLSNAGDMGVLTSGSFSLMVIGLEGAQLAQAHLIFFITTAITFALMAMIARNISLSFKTADGKTKFSEGATPFQQPIVRMIREIGIFCIAIPIVQLVMSIIAALVLGYDVAETSVNLVGIFVGLVVLCLSQFFVYGVELQRDTDGLV